MVASQSSTFDLLSTTYGCPQHPGIRWETGAVSYTFPDNSISWSKELHLQGPLRHNLIQWNLCKANIDDETPLVWPPGNYCTVQSGQCSQGEYLHLICRIYTQTERRRPVNGIQMSFDLCVIPAQLFFSILGFFPNFF